MNKKFHTDIKNNERANRPNKIAMLVVTLSAVIVLWTTISMRMRLSRLDTATKQLVDQSTLTQKAFHHSLNSTKRVEAQLDSFAEKVILMALRDSISNLPYLPYRTKRVSPADFNLKVDTTKVDSLVLNWSESERIENWEKFFKILKLSLLEEKKLRSHISQQNIELDKLRQENREFEEKLKEKNY